MSRFAFMSICLILAAPAAAQEPCGACTELDRATMADPVPPTDLPTPPRRQSADRGLPIEVPLPGETITVYHKPGAGLWVGDLAPGGVYVRPKQGKLSLDMRF